MKPMWKCNCSLTMCVSSNTKRPTCCYDPPSETCVYQPVPNWKAVPDENRCKVCEGMLGNPIDKDEPLICDRCRIDWLKVQLAAARGEQK